MILHSGSPYPNQVDNKYNYIIIPGTNEVKNNYREVLWLMRIFHDFSWFYLPLETRNEKEKTTFARESTHRWQLLVVNKPPWSALTFGAVFRFFGQ